MNHLNLQTKLPQNSALRCLKRGKCEGNYDSHFKQSHFMDRCFNSPMAMLLCSILFLLGTSSPAFSQVAKNYQHWADVSVANWNGDVLNDSKSDYFEGQVIPHVHVIQGTNKKPLVTGRSYTFTIIYNFYQQNTRAGGFAYVTTYNRSRNPGLLPGASGLVPLLDNTATAGLNIGGSQGFFYTRNADITAATAPVKSGSGTFDNTVTVTFTYTGTNPQGMVEIYYGLYIAEPGQVPDQGNGPTNGASAWSGGSLQTTVLSDFSGALSIQLSPSAIIRGEISGLKYRDTNNNGIRNTGEGPLSGWTFYLDLNNNGVLNTGEPTDITAADGIFSFSVTPDADKTDADNDPYYVRELQNQTGWTLTQPASGFYGPILITVADPAETGLLFGNFICVNPVAAETHTDALCNGASSGTATISATGGTGPYTFAKGAGAYQSSGLFQNLAAGTYTFYVKEANGCIDDVTVVIGEPTAVVAAETHTNALCNGASSGTATISATGGASPYTFNLGTGSYQSSGLFQNLSAGTYTFHAKDANGCIDDVTVVIGESTAVVAAETHTNALCNGTSSGTATISATGGTSPYTFNLGTGSYQSSGLFQNLSAGTYTFHAKDANGCIDDVTVVIGEPTAVVAAETHTNALCNGASSGTATISATGGTSPYTFNLGSGTYQSSGLFQNLSAGTYTFHAKDVNGCIDDVTVVIGEPNALVATESHTDALCNGTASGTATISASGGTAPYTFNLGTGTYQSSGLFQNLSAGTYTFHAKDANGCIDDVVVNIGDVGAVIASESHTDALCNGAATGTATISATGGKAPYTFANGSGSYQSSGLFEDLSAGTYTFHAKDANGCIDDVTVVIGEPDQLTATAVANALCDNGVLTVSLTITPSGGVGPYVITPVATGVEGSFSYTVTDANGCSCEVVNNLKKETTATSALSKPETISSSSPLKREIVTKNVVSESDKLAITAYPNPFLNEVNFSFKSPASGYAQLEIFDITGKRIGIVFKGNVKGNAQQAAQFSVPADAARTMLVYRLSVGNKVMSGKVIPQ